MDTFNQSGRSLSDPAYQAYKILQIAFVLALILAGVDKFFNVMVDWTKYIAPVVSHLVSVPIFMHVIGAVEIIAGLIVAVNPRIGATIVALWLTSIILNLLLVHNYYDVTLRDFGLLLGALALSRLSVEFKK